MGRFDVGSRWRCNSAPSPWYHVGGIYEIQDAPATDGYMAISDDRSFVGIAGMLTTEAHINKYFTRIPDEIPVGEDPDLPIHIRMDRIHPASPIREITKREIVPGVYSHVSIGEAGRIGCQVHLNLGVYSADELDAAASVLTQIAAVLRENSNG